MGNSFDKHFLKKETIAAPDPETGKPRTKKHWACGEAMTSDFYKAAPDGVEPTCSKCSAFWAQQQLKGRTDLRLEPCELSSMSDFRSMYRAYLKDELVAFISVKKGWGKSWTICTVGIWDDKPHRDKQVRAGLHSKNAALLAVPKLREEGALPTFAEAVAARDALQAKLNDQRVKRAERDRVEAEARKLTIETLEKMAADTARFSNLERNSLLDAVERLNGSGREDDE